MKKDKTMSPFEALSVKQGMVLEDKKIMAYKDEKGIRILRYALNWAAL